MNKITHTEQPQTLKTFFMNRDKSFDEVSILEESPYSRKIKFLSGDKKGKVIKAHPNGVSWGSMYPRIFTSAEKPQNTFIYNGRCIVETYDFASNPQAEQYIPPAEKYIFQPITADIIDSINLKKNIILTGGSGIGKTSCILQIAHSIRQPTLRINFTAHTQPSDLLGSKELVDGKTFWQDGVLPQAMKNGYWIIFDELDSAPPELLPIIYPVLERTSTVTMKENNGEVIHAHPNFRCFATANTIGAMQSRRHRFKATQQASDALTSRFDVFHMKNMTAKEEFKLVRETYPQLSPRVAKRIVDFAEKVRTNEEKQQSTFTVGDFSTRQVLAWAEKTALHRNASKGAKLSWLDKIDVTEQDAAIKALELMFGSKDVKAILPAVKRKTVVRKQQKIKNSMAIAA